MSNKRKLVRSSGRASRFTCAHCGTPVGRGERILRNACPSCHWSRHVYFGAKEGFPPCGGMMEPHLRGDGRYAEWHCLGCEFVISGPVEQEMERLAAADLQWNWRLRARGGP